MGVLCRRLGLPVFVVTVWGTCPTLSSHGGFIISEYAALGYRHAKLELGKQTLRMSHVFKKQRLEN